MSNNENKYKSIGVFELGERILIMSGFRRRGWLRSIGVAALSIVALSWRANALQEAVEVGRPSPRSLAVESAETSIDVPGSTEAQNKPDANQEPQSDSSNTGVTFKRVFLNLPGDQKRLWTSPFHLQPHDSAWLVPLATGTALLIGSDAHSMARARSNPDAINLANNISNGTLIGLTAVPATMYLWSGLHDAPRLRETGLLSGEAAINSLIVNEALKVVFSRERPTALDGQGKFFSTPWNGSFPSTHSTLGWTVASVIAHEYPGWLSQSLAYAAATTISISRVAGRQHFPSDVVVGGSLGWLIGRNIYNAHHDRDLDGANFGTFSQQPGGGSGGGEEVHRTPASPFVPLDSWIYPALARLAALGYIKTQFVAQRPWTRLECKRQTEEAEYYSSDLSPESEVSRTVARLKEEFREDGAYFYRGEIESLYAREQYISGVPLRDSYHFGQTIWDDFGRPYDEGNNVLVGGSGSAVAGQFFFYARGEYQHAPGRGPLTDAQRTLVAQLDLNPVQPAAAVSAIDRFYPLDLYGGVQLGPFAATFGKQSLWLGPGQSSPLMLSDNADPMYTLRLSQTTPEKLPWIFKYLGETKVEFLFSKLSGHQFPARPFFNLQKVSFHPTQNLEIGFTRASVWAGVGHPFTFHALLRNLGSFNDSSQDIIDPNDPGDRKSGFDFSYRIPGLRNWLQVYSEFYSDDDPSPLASPRRSAMNPGLYLSHFPRISRLDLRVEAVSTQLLGVDHGGLFLYFSNEYHDANLNKGFLFGNPTGRDGRTYQAWSTYHFSAATDLQFAYRDTKISTLFLPGGGTQSDASTRLQWEISPRFTVGAFVQYERWLIPSLQATAQQNVTGRVEFTFHPKWRLQTNATAE